MVRALAVAAVAVPLCLPLWAQERQPAPRLYAIYEPVVSASDLPILQRIRPELVCRGWFKWAGARDYRADEWILRRCHQLGIRVQGGVTVAAIYPDENGITEEQFLDYATRDPRGELVPVSGWYHVALHNPALREYIKGFVRAQIDAGVDGIWFDEIEGIYGWVHEGYDAHTIRAFTDYLVGKYVNEMGWAEDDPRFLTELGVDLAQFGPTIRDFDYREWLLASRAPDGGLLSDDPWQGPWDEPWLSANPLYREWGHAWRPDPRSQATFQGRAVLEFWREFVDDAREYARRTTGRDLVITCNENGTPRPWVDFQQPHDGALPQVTPEGDLDTTYRCLPWVEERVRLAAEVTPDAPVVQFVDWPGESDRLVSLPQAQIATFLHTYVPEAYAGGALFALPVKGYTYEAARHGMLRDTALLADHLRRYDELLFEGTVPSAMGVQVERGDVEVRVRENAHRKMIHLIDHRPITDREAIDLAITVGPVEGYVWTVSTRQPFELGLTMKPGGRLVVEGFRDSALVAIEDVSPSVSGRVLNREGEPIAGAVVTWVQGSPEAQPLPSGSARRVESLGRVPVVRSAQTDSEGRWAMAGLPGGSLYVQAEGYQPAETRGGEARLDPAEGVRAVVFLVDHLGCLAPGQAIWKTAPGLRVATVTDAFGAARITVPSDRDVTLNAVDPVFLTRVTSSIAGEPEGPFLTLQLPPPDQWIGDFEMGPSWTPNDARKSAGEPAVTRIGLVEDGPHREASVCAEISFDGLPEGGWANAYSQPVDLSPYNAIRFWYAGEPSARGAAITLHCLGTGDGERFLRAPVGLGGEGWQEVVVDLGEFTDAVGGPRPEDLQRVSVQVSVSGEGPLEPWNVRLWGLRAYRRGE
jgi:hypothetical protein